MTDDDGSKDVPQPQVVGTDLPEAGEDSDPVLDPTKSPGFGVQNPADIDVGRDVTLGEAEPASFTAADTAPVADAEDEDLRLMLDAPEAPTRRRAALALADRDPTEETVEALSRAARTDPDAEVRQFAVEALGDLGGGDAVAVAEDALGDADPWVRSEAVVALDHLSREAHVAALSRALADEHPAVRRNAMIALFRVRGDEMERTLVALTRDPSDRVREWAAQLLGELDSERAAAVLERVAAHDPSDIVRATAARAHGMDPEDLRRAVERPSTPTGTGTDVLNQPPDL